MDWKQKLQSVRASGQQNLDQTTQVLIEEQWPKIQLIFQEKIGPAVLAAAQNDQAMESVLKTAYTLLPFPARMVINEGAFVTFCLNHRQSLLPPAGTPISTP